MWAVALAAAAAGALIGWVVQQRVSSRREPVVAEVDDARPLAEPTAAEVLEQLHLGVAISGRDGAGEFRNAAATAMAGTHVGVLLNDAIGRHLTSGLTGTQSEEVVEFYGPPKAVYVVHSAPLPAGGAVAFVEDISEQRRVDSVRTDFVANVSHELKTPVGAISVLAQTLEGETDLVVVERLAARLLTETDRAATIIDDLMELSRVELGGDRDVAPVDVAHVIAGAVDRVREVAERRSIRVNVVDVAPDLRVVGDAHQLVSAIGNLVENAVNYSDEGASVEIEVTADSPEVEIAVSDHGVGIPSADLERIFERFYRVDRARSRQTGGSGLGLSIVRHVVTLHDGRVAAESIEGEGSRFAVMLPLAGDLDEGLSS